MAKLRKVESSIQRQLRKEEVLKDKIVAGEWQALPFVEAFWERSPDGQILAIREAMNNRINQLRETLPELMREDQKAAYVQILDYIHELETKRDSLTSGFMSKLGRRKLS